jgi:hypothetical protein
LIHWYPDSLIGACRCIQNALGGLLVHPSIPPFAEVDGIFRVYDDDDDDDALLLLLLLIGIMALMRLTKDASRLFQPDRNALLLASCED